MESSFLITGILFGLSAGLTPGPMLTLVISESMRKGTRAGVTIASAPLLTDLPIIVVTQWVLIELSQINVILGVISIAGSLLLAWYAWESFFMKDDPNEEAGSSRTSLKKGILTNFTNPNPYLFWITIGGPVLLSSYRSGYTNTAMFLAGMYVFLIGSKASLAVITSKSRDFLHSRLYHGILKALGLILAGFSVHFFMKGIAFF